MSGTKWVKRMGSDARKKALHLGSTAVERLMADQGRAEKIFLVVGRVQRGKAAIDSARDGALRAVQFATRNDYKSIGKRLSTLQRRMREMAQRLDRLDRHIG